jgi:hypothetical protein
MLRISQFNFLRDWLPSGDSKNLPPISESITSEGSKSGELLAAGTMATSVTVSTSGKEILGKLGGAFNLFGVVTVGNLLANWGSDILFEDAGEDDPSIRLAKRVYKTEIEDLSLGLFGSWLGRYSHPFFGDLASGVITGVELLSKDVAKGREMEREKVRNSLIQDSELFIMRVRYSIFGGMARAISPENLQIQWDVVQKTIQEFYSKKPGLIQEMYSLLDDTGFLVKDAAEIKAAIREDGTISPGGRGQLLRIAHEGFQAHLSSRIEDLERLSQEVLGKKIGLSEIEEALILIGNLDEAKKKRLKEKIIPILNDIQTDRLIIDVLKRDKDFPRSI